MKTIRNSIIFKEDFIKGFVGGRKLAREATDREAQLLTDYNNSIIRLNNEVRNLWAGLADLEERESNLSFFIRERLELNNKRGDTYEQDTAY